MSQRLRRGIVTLAVTLVAALSLVPAASLARAGETIAVRAKRIHTGSGAPVEQGVLVVEDGKVVAVRRDVPRGAQLLDRPDAVLVAGFVDVDSTVGARGNLADTARAVQPELDAADALDPLDADFELALRHGVTTAVLLPRGSLLAGGVVAAVKTGGPPADRRLALERPAVSLSVGRDVERVPNRVPTARMGTYDLFRRTLDSAKSGDGPLAEAALGGRPALVHASDARDVRLIADEASSRGVDAAVRINADLLPSIEALGSRPIPVVLGPFGPRTPHRLLRTPASLARQGHTVALTGASGSAAPGSLRTTAALAARYGLPARQAIAAITSVPARIAGADSRVGSLEPGKDADFVLLSGDPLDLSARVIEVYIDGRRVYRAPNPKE